MEGVERMLIAATSQQPPSAAGAERIRNELFRLSEAQLKVLRGPKYEQLHVELARYFLVAAGALSAAAAHQARNVPALLCAADLAYYSPPPRTQQHDDNAPTVSTLLKARAALSKQDASYATTYGIQPDGIALVTAVVVGTVVLALVPQDAFWLSARLYFASASAAAVFYGKEQKESSSFCPCLPRMLLTCLAKVVGQYVNDGMKRLLSLHAVLVYMLKDWLMMICLGNACMCGLVLRLMHQVTWECMYTNTFCLAKAQ